MVLVRETSRGTLALKLAYNGRWVGHTVDVFELDLDGWSSNLGVWGSYRDKQGPLESFLAEKIGLPADEARRLAEEAFSGFRERGGEQTLSRLQWVRAFAMLSFALTEIFVLVPLLAVGLVVLIAVLVL